MLFRSLFGDSKNSTFYRELGIRRDIHRGISIGVMKSRMGKMNGMDATLSMCHKDNCQGHIVTIVFKGGKKRPFRQFR